jgi:hypothetical protein
MQLDVRSPKRGDLNGSTGQPCISYIVFKSMLVFISITVGLSRFYRLYPKIFAQL